MKIESIYHSKEARRKECKNDKADKRHSKDPIHHPMLLEREYVRALNAVKTEKMLSKPFITALSHHKEGISRLTKDLNSNIFASSSYDNKMVVWDLYNKNILFEKQYSNLINGIAVNTNDELTSIFVSQNRKVEHINMGYSQNIHEYAVESTVSSIDFLQDICIGHGSGISVFDVNRITPKMVYSCDEITTAKFNRSFKYIMGGLNRLNINLFDNRACKEFMKIEQPGSNCISFNPQQGYVFACGNEDGNGYLYDIRNESKPVETYRGHTNAVVSISFSPDGKEIVTGSYDRTIRIFKVDERKPRDCYYNDRMQIVHAVEYSNDGDFIISGSDDGSLRLWKAHASKKSGPTSKYEKEALQYAEALKEKFKHVEEISRISKHNFLNKEIRHEMRIKHEMHQGQLRRAAKKEKENELKEKQSESEDI